MRQNLTADWQTIVRVPYALRRIPNESMSCLLPRSDSPVPGDIALASVEKIGRNDSVELRDGRRCSLHKGDLLAVVFGNRYATRQFEGYARVDGEHCDLLSMGGMCGLVVSKHTECGDPTKLHLLGRIGDSSGSPLHLRQFAISPAPCNGQPDVRVVVVCGASMESGKTHTAMSIIAGIHKQEYRVAGAKLTGTAAGRDRFKMLDAGACVALDFVDGGLPSTYLCDLEELINLQDLFVASAASHHAACLVVEIADGLLQNETAALLQSARFRETVDAWIFAAGDPLAATGGVSVLRSWGVNPLAVSGLVSMSPLCQKEVQMGTGLPCLTAQELERGKLTAQLLGLSQKVEAHPDPAVIVPTAQVETQQAAE